MWQLKSWVVDNVAVSAMGCCQHGSLLVNVASPWGKGECQYCRGGVHCIGYLMRWHSGHEVSSYGGTGLALWQCCAVWGCVVGQHMS